MKAIQNNHKGQINISAKPAVERDGKVIKPATRGVVLVPGLNRLNDEQYSVVVSDKTAQRYMKAKPAILAEVAASEESEDEADAPDVTKMTKQELVDFAKAEFEIILNKEEFNRDALIERVQAELAKNEGK